MNEDNKFIEKNTYKGQDDNIDNNKVENIGNDKDENMGKKKKNNKKLVVFMIALLIVTNAVTAMVSPRIYSNIVTKIPLEQVKEFKKLFTVKGDIDKYYVDKYDEEKMINGAIKGMVSAVGDPYTTYMDKTDYEKWNTETAGKYIGIGIHIGVTKEDKVVVISPFKGSPADKVGIKPQDVILKVNNLNVTPDTLNDAVATMKGKKGTKINLTLWRKDKGEFNMQVVTDEIKMQTVASQMLEGNIGYITMTMFDENAGESFLNELKNVRDKDAKGIILDLRGNPGGLVSQCIQTTSHFIPEGKTIVYTKDKDGNKEEYQSMGGLAQDLPLVVLVDEGSASASEIFSAAIRDYKRGTLIGTKTFGKGKVQNILDKNIFGIGDGTALKITISYYYTPKGENIDKKGIEPDIKVEYPNALRMMPYDQKTDPQLQKAIEVMKEKMNK